MKKIDYNIFLIGFMGTGKSTISGELSKMMAMQEIDVDQYIVQQQNRSIPEIFETDGEEYFRNLETKALESFGEKRGLLVSCGGGAVLRKKNVDIMKKQGKTVLLTASPETIYERIKNCKNRPLLKGNMGVDYIHNMMKKREPYYQAAADLVITTDHKSVETICLEIVEKL